MIRKKLSVKNNRNTANFDIVIGQKISGTLFSTIVIDQT